MVCAQNSWCRLKGIKVGRDSPSITHLLFTDYLLLFGKATVREASILDDCLSEYMAWSGQKVNRAKSSVHFSKNLRGQPLVAIMDHLQLRKLPSKAKHLGLPLIIPRSKGEAAVEIKEKFLKKITGWKAKILSQAGRTMMIKAVAGAIPSYFLGYYAMPNAWCKDLDRFLKNFLWGYKVKKPRNLSLKGWKSICLPKCGGLGIRLFSDINTALVSKLAWFMISQKERLWVRVLGGKYLRGKSVMEAGVSVGDLWIWRSIVKY
ncbi:hypothetical protein CJ030_MR1G016594 [Morella rubra]|uniref:Uncharacterized protein n=1 Tax=Morella rubra TaxID=262757 RepID=A0A6A1WIT3_9ROSI|nr:hypothetical protein CJ030_MR1G016594 [Morella rubra]